MLRGRRGRKRGKWGALGGALCPVRPPKWGAGPPASQPWLPCSIGDLLLLLFTDRMAGSPASTHPNSPVSNTPFGLIVLPVQMEIFCRVKQWSCELPGSSACFPTSVPFCLSAASRFKFSQLHLPSSLTALRDPPPKPILQLALAMFDLSSQGVTCTFVFSSKRKPIWFQWHWRHRLRLCRFSIYYRVQMKGYCFVKLYKGEKIPHSCFFLSSFVARSNKNMPVSSLMTHQGKNRSSDLFMYSCIREVEVYWKCTGVRKT